MIFFLYIHFGVVYLYVFLDAVPSVKFLRCGHNDTHKRTCSIVLLVDSPRGEKEPRFGTRNHSRIGRACALKLSGVSNPNGFIIQGVSDPYLVLQAAHEAKRRLLSGEKDLAVHPRCGTTSVVTGLVFAILFIVFSILFGLFSFVNLCFH